MTVSFGQNQNQGVEVRAKQTVCRTRKCYDSSPLCHSVWVAGVGGGLPGMRDVSKGHVSGECMRGSEDR